MAYPLPGFGRNPFVDDGHDQQASPPPASTVGAPWGSSSSSSSKQQMLDASFPADPPSRYPAKLAHGSSQNKRRPQTAQQAAMSHAERIVRDPALWQGFKAMIRERRNDVALPTTNLLAVEYLHQFVEHQFELEAERIAQEEAVYYYEIQRRYESADSSSKSDKEYCDGRITLQKAARWLTGSFSLSLSSVDREKEAAALAAAYDAQRASQQQSSALVMSCRENMSISSSSIESDAPQGSDNEGSSSSSNSFSDSLTSFLKEAAHLTTPESLLIPKLQLQRRRAPRDLSTHDEDIIDESEELEVDGRLNVAENYAPRSDEYSSAAQERQEEEHNNRRVHYHSHPRPPLPRPQGPPPSALASSRSSNGRGRRQNGPVLPASRGVPLAGILEYGEQDYEHYSPAAGDPTASTLSRCPVPPPVSLQEQTPSWGPRAA